MIAVDTNLLVYAHRSSTPENATAQRAIERAANLPGGWGIPLPCLSEFWSVVTNAALPNPSPRETAAEFVNELLTNGGALVLLPRKGFWARLMEQAQTLDIVGGRIFDLQIAVIAKENGVKTFWTHDRKFCHVPGIEIVDPLG